ncbi:uncharacterized protein TNCV_3109991 [Trichonephila clavipes]|nr:uncharacterized protein TNCV_3109991 [Trichonephila clavipes]
MNPDSISAVRTIVFLCDDPVVNASILHLLYNDTTPPTGVMVWGVIAVNTLLPLLLIRGTMTNQRYVHDILQTHVLPLMQRFPETLFEQDNARPHTLRVLLPFLDLPDPQICLQSSTFEIIWDGELIISRVSAN